MRDINCPLCNCEHYDILSVIKKDKYLSALNKPFHENRKVMCKNCGLTYQNPQLDNNENQEMYTKLLRSSKLSSEKPTEEYLYWKAIKAHKDLKWLKNFISVEKKRVLDIGCAEGNLLRLFKEKECDVKGVEPTSYAKFGEEKYDLDIVNDFFENTNFPDSYFDIVTFTAVLEHIPDPINFLKLVKSILKDNGYVYLEVPNVYKPKLDFADFIGAQHLLLFSPNTLVAMLEKSGLQIVKIDDQEESLRALAKKKNTYDNHYEEMKLLTKKDDFSQIAKILKKHKRKYFFFKQKNKLKGSIKMLLIFLFGEKKVQYSAKRIKNLIKKICTLL